MHSQTQTRRRPFALVGIAVAALAGGLLFGAAPATAAPGDDPDVVEPTATFTASKDTVAVGEEFTLTWTSSGYDELSDGDESGPYAGDALATMSGSAPISEGVPGEYVYVLWGLLPGEELYTEAARATVTVEAAADPSATLTASSTTVAVGEEFTLTWTSSGYDAVAFGDSADVGNGGPLPDLNGSITDFNNSPGDYEYVLWGLLPGDELYEPVATVTVTVIDNEEPDFGDLVTAESQECHAFTFTNVTSDFDIVVRYRADGQDTMEFVTVPYGESATIEYDADEVFYIATLEGVGESGPSTAGAVLSAECETAPPADPVDDEIDNATLPVTGPADAGLLGLIAAVLLAGGIALTRIRRA